VEVAGQMVPEPPLHPRGPSDIQVFFKNREATQMILKKKKILNATNNLGHRVRGQGASVPAPETPEQTQGGLVPQLPPPDQQGRVHVENGNHIA
jgi:hypothetical protein